MATAHRMVFGRFALGLLRATVAAWLLIGVLVGVLAAAEAGSTVLRTLERGDPRANADVYRGSGATWAEEYFREDDAAKRMRWEPYVYWRRRPFRGKYININEAGIRRSWHDGSCEEAGKPHIAMFGGSTLWGTGARDDFTIPSLLAKSLAKLGYEACVINFGESGYVTTQEIIALMKLLQHGSRPSLAIFYDGVNDTGGAFQSGIAGTPQNEQNRIVEFNLSKRRMEMFWRIWLASETFHVLQEGMAKIGRRTSAYPGERADIEVSLAKETLSVYRENVRIARLLGEERGFDTLFYWQPVVFDKQWLTPYEQRQAKRRGFGRFHQLVSRFVRDDPTLRAERGFSFLADIFANRRDPLFIDDAHLGEAGNHIIAERIARDVVRVLSGQTKRHD